MSRMQDYINAAKVLDQIIHQVIAEQRRPITEDELVARIAERVKTRPDLLYTLAERELYHECARIFQRREQEQQQ